MRAFSVLVLVCLAGCIDQNRQPPIPSPDIELEFTLSNGCALYHVRNRIGGRDNVDVVTCGDGNALATWQQRIGKRLVQRSVSTVVVNDPHEVPTVFVPLTLTPPAMLEAK